MSKTAWQAMKPPSVFLSVLKVAAIEEKQSLVLGGQSGTRALIVSSVKRPCSHGADNGMKINDKRIYQPLVLMVKQDIMYM